MKLNSIDDAESLRCIQCLPHGSNGSCNAKYEFWHDMYKQSDRVGLITPLLHLGIYYEVIRYLFAHNAAYCLYYYTFLQNAHI
jgi:hypothetical protein